MKCANHPNLNRKDVWQITGQSWRYARIVQQVFEERYYNSLYELLLAVNI